MLKISTMNYIIFDIEATCWNGYASSNVQETIELGALLINDYGEVEDEFSSFIRPVINPFLSTYCTELTTIRQADVTRADRFPEVIEDFQDWIGFFDKEDYLLCSWGRFDQKQLIEDCQYHNLDYKWLKSYIDLREQYQDMKRLRKPRSLKKIVENEGFDFTGIQHRAYYDAENLAKIFVVYRDVWRF